MHIYFARLIFYPALLAFNLVGCSPAAEPPLAVASNPSPSAIPIPAASTASAPAFVPSLAIPSEYKISIAGLPSPAAPSSGPGWFGSTVLAALLAALASVITAWLNASKQSLLQTALQEAKLENDNLLAMATREHEETLRALDQRHQNDIVLQQQSHDAALKERDHNHATALKQLDLEHQRTAQGAMLKRDDQRLDTERQRLRRETDASDFEIEIAAARLVREREAETAKLIHLFFDRLASENAVHRALAVRALSDFVDAAEMSLILEAARVAPAVETAISDSSGKVTVQAGQGEYPTPPPNSDASE